MYTCTTLAAYLSADTISYYCVGLPVCHSLCPLLPSWSLLPSVGFGSALGAPFCCEGWALGPSDTFSYYAAKGLFGCGPIGLEWSPCWAVFLADELPFQILHLPQVLLLLAVTGLGAPLSSGVLKRHYRSLQNEWMKIFWLPLLMKLMTCLCSATSRGLAPPLHASAYTRVL